MIVHKRNNVRSASRNLSLEHSLKGERFFFNLPSHTGSMHFQRYLFADTNIQKQYHCGFFFINLEGYSKEEKNRQKWRIFNGKVVLEVL